MKSPLLLAAAGVAALTLAACGADDQAYESPAAGDTAADAAGTAPAVTTPDAMTPADPNNPTGPAEIPTPPPPVLPTDPTNPVIPPPASPPPA